METSKSILIVDDEQEIRESLAKRFARRGFKVFTADGGTEGFKIAVENSVDVLLTDIRMAKGSGITLVEEVRATLGDNCPTLICMSAFSDLTVEGAFLRGVDLLMPKPLDTAALFAAIDHFYKAWAQRLRTTSSAS